MFTLHWLHTASYKPLYRFKTEKYFQNLIRNFMFTTQRKISLFTLHCLHTARYKPLYRSKTEKKYSKVTWKGESPFSGKYIMPAFLFFSTIVFSFFHVLIPIIFKKSIPTTFSSLEICFLFLSLKCTYVHLLQLINGNVKRTCRNKLLEG